MYAALPIPCEGREAVSYFLVKVLNVTTLMPQQPLKEKEYMEYLSVNILQFLLTIPNL